MSQSFVELYHLETFQRTGEKGVRQLSVTFVWHDFWNMLSSHLPVPSGCKLSAISSKVSSLVIQFREYTLFLPLTAPHLLYVYRAKYMLIS